MQLYYRNEKSDAMRSAVRAQVDCRLEGLAFFGDDRIQE
jgi:hypothetical protein